LTIGMSLFLYFNNFCWKFRYSRPGIYSGILRE
jgi:hypothetical protein